MNKVLAVLSGIGVGAALMFLYDPRGGRRRRALIRDKAGKLTHDARHALDQKTKDLSNRARGLMHDAKAKLSGARGEETEPAGRTL